MAYTGAWRQRYATPQPMLRLVQPIDPQHLSPDDNLNGTNNWIADTAVPTLPEGLYGEQYILGPAKGGPIDYTPEDPEFGTGVGHALTQTQWQDEILPRHAQDLGSTDARKYIHPKDIDGSWHADVIEDIPGQGTPPESGYNATRYVTGVGAVNDPDARRGSRIWRWRERWLDKHMWDVDYRPALLKTAYTAPEQQEQANGNQYTSPFSANVLTSHAGITSPDNFVAPEIRRQPRPWDEALATDGISQTNEFGLTVWGL